MTQMIATIPSTLREDDSPLRIVILGLSITSSWGNGHATTYRALVRELARLGHDCLFLECDKPWYAAHRDLPSPPFGRTRLYKTLGELRRKFGHEIRAADAVIVGSYVPQGIEIGRWVLEQADGITAFYDIDTPVTLARLQRGEADYISRELIQRYDLYLSFTGGPTLRYIERELGSPRARALYCSVDPHLYFPDRRIKRVWDLGYLGTYSPDRQPTLEKLLLEPARKWADGRFVVAGPQYPPEVEWGSVTRIEHLPPDRHRAFYNQQRFTLNVTRQDMIRAGYSPSVRLFEAAAWGTPIISDWWEGLDTLLTPGHEILIAADSRQALRILREMPERERTEIARRARERILASHTSAHRAAELVRFIRQAGADQSPDAHRPISSAAWTDSEMRCSSNRRTPTTNTK
jgi:spore maturation protein CgeB